MQSSFLSLRKNGQDALRTVLNIDANIKIIEKHIFSQSYSLNKDGITIEEDYKEYLFQIIGDILEKKKLKDILNSIKNNKLGWNHSSFEQISFILQEQDDFILKPFEVVEGVIECRCGSNRVFSYSKQNRGADEPMTTYAECVKCKHKWTYSG